MAAERRPTMGLGSTTSKQSKKVNDGYFGDEKKTLGYINGCNTP